MKIGFDFDNTIVSYDRLFYDIAIEQSFISKEDGIAMNKNAVRNFLRAKDMEEQWIWMQGYGYGHEILKAKAFDGAIDVIRALHLAGHELFIISHKTQFPFRGERYDLHASARQWIKKYLVHKDGSEIFDENHAFFNPTKAQKVRRIGQCDCQIFLDDLPEILGDDAFPQKTLGILFDPQQYHGVQPFHTISQWGSLYDIINDQPKCS